MVEHSDLTGASLHETIGADAASANTVHIADGAGSTSWAKVTTDNIDATDIFNINQYWVPVAFADISTAETIYYPISHDCTFTKATIILQTGLTGTDSTLTFTNSTGPIAIGTKTITQSGSTAGTIYTYTPSVHN
jgi:hypothetical protein